jgi:hypothetical protein
MVGNCNHRDILFTMLLFTMLFTMRSLAYTRALLLALPLMGATCSLAQNPVFELAAKQQSAKVTIMAISVSVHHGYAGNREVYLADVELKGSSHQLAKVVDSYAASGVPIRRSILAERHVLEMRLIRDAECDTTGRDFFLGADDANLFDGATRAALQEKASAILPCFTAVHDATRLAK